MELKRWRERKLMAILVYKDGEIEEIKGFLNESGVELKNVDKDKFLSDRGFIH